MNLLEQQASNKRRTWLVVAFFLAFLAMLGYGFDRFYLGVDAPIPLASFVALVIGVVSALAGYYAGDRAVLASTGAIPIEQLRTEPGQHESLGLRQLENVVDEMAIASGLPKPRVYLVPDSDPNAFATGRDPEHASIAVTQGLLDLTNREELQGVIAHEMSHIRNYDIRLLTVVAALVGAVALLADWASRGMRFAGSDSSRRRKKDGGGGAAIFFVIWLVAIILAPLIGRLLAMAVSRQREYLADASGAELTRNPEALANALEKIDEAAGPTRSVKQGTAHLCIADPMGRAVSSLDGKLADLFASHPPMSRRIAALRSMAYTPTSSSPNLNSSGCETS